LDFPSLFTNDLIYRLASGPLVKISFAVFVLGIGVRTKRLLALTRVEKRYRTAPHPILRKKFFDQFSLKVVLLHIKAVRHTVLSKSPVTILVSFVFHLCLFIAPFFLLAHQILIERSFGFSLFSFSEHSTHVMAAVFLLCAFYFFMRRILLARVRMITSAYDYLILVLTSLPFLTGILAYYQFYDYRTMMVLHMLSGELMLITAPFTKVFHMVFFFVGRFVLINQHTLGKGSRVWVS
jgi:nitrate reductase gamma subunit